MGRIGKLFSYTSRHSGSHKSKFRRTNLPETYTRKWNGIWDALASYFRTLPDTQVRTKARFRVPICRKLTQEVERHMGRIGKLFLYTSRHSGSHKSTFPRTNLPETYTGSGTAYGTHWQAIFVHFPTLRFAQKQVSAYEFAGNLHRKWNGIWDALASYFRTLPDTQVGTKASFRVPICWKLTQEVERHMGRIGKLFSYTSRHSGSHKSKFPRTNLPETYTGSGTAYGTHWQAIFVHFPTLSLAQKQVSAYQ